MESEDSIRGHSKLSFESYLYTRQKALSGDIISYECELRRNETVRLRFKALDGQNVGCLCQYTHVPSSRRVEVVKVTTQIERKAMDMQETT